MKAIQDYLVEKQQQFAQHPLFVRLLEDRSWQEFTSLAAHLSFWLMSFQDLLRLNEERINNVELRHIVRQHRLQDIAHEQYFLTDMSQIQGKTINVRSLYSPNHATTREATYALMSEVFQARYDYERTALLLTVESAADVFWEFSVDFVENIGEYTSILYFLPHHLHDDKYNQTFAQKINAYLAELQINQTQYQQIYQMIDRVYHTFNLMLDGLEIITTSDNKPVKPSPLALV